MTGPRSRKRLAKLRRGATTAAIGCCIVAAAAAASSSTTVATTAMHTPPSYRVTPNDAPRRKLESRRRMQQDYYRRLAAQQNTRHQEGSLGEAHVEDASNLSDGSSSQNQQQPPRRLPASVHKKGRDYDYNTQAAKPHKKGNNDSSEDEPVGGFMLMGNNNNNQSTQNKPPPPAPAPLPASAPQDENLRLATNLQKFTRIGGIGYALPPTKRYPYMASLQLEGHSPNTGDPYDIHMCGGVLVAPDLVMTSAHCAHYSPPGTDETYQAFNGIEIGKVDLSQPAAKFDPYSLETYKKYYENLIPDKLHLHPQFNEDTYQHDVMLVKIFGMSRFPPVKLHRNEINTDDEDIRVTVLGFGAEHAHTQKKYSDQLKSADMNLMTLDQCRDINVEVVDPYTDVSSIMSLRDHVFDDMMCATSSQRYICYGDAGGPAIRRGSNNDEDELVGLLSWGYGCVNRDYPAVMTRISDHYNWIRNTICKESSDPPEEYGCAPKNTMQQYSGGKTTVTLKLRLDAMAEETGFVIQHRDTNEIVAQRQTGYWKNEKYGNELVLERMDIPANQCYVLTMLDSFGDGHCCDQGGGNAILYWGTDVGYYSGDKLVEINGNFEFDSSGEFCTTGPTSSMNTQTTNTNPNHSKENPKPSPQVYNPPPPVPKTPNPTRMPTPQPVRPPPTPQTNLQFGGLGVGKTYTGATWSGPVMNPEYEYCNQFCSTSAHGVLCGNYECVHITTDDSQEEEEDHQDDEPQGPLTSSEFFEEGSEYFLTVVFQFDDNPEEISWVLYDLTSNEVKIFVDFDVYTKDEYANNMLELKVTMPGPEEGEKQYAFTVYDKSSNGLCCDHGEGYYKVYLGDIEDDLELLGDDVFDFSSSYYFTLFEMEGMDAAMETYSPTLTPSHEPTPKPTPRPTQPPSRPPTQYPTYHPTHPPTTARPTNPWELRRPEHADEIAKRWNIRTNTPPGVFNDVGGDQHKYKFNMDGTIRNGATRGGAIFAGRTSGLLLSGAVFVCSFALGMILL